MSKILVTMLGTGDMNGNYRSANYQLDGKIYENENSIAKVLTNHYGIEKVFVLGTTGSIWDNLYDVFEGKDKDKKFDLRDKRKNESISGEDLSFVSCVIDEYTGGNGSGCFLIDYGINNDELWSNFHQYLKISEHIHDGDELYLDVTHAFRSLSMMSLDMTQFIEEVRREEINIKGIFYGIFEYSRKNNNITPIVDISMLADIQEWTKAVGYFKRYGNASMLYDLMRSGKVTTDKEAGKVFKQLANSIYMGDINGIKKSVKTIKRDVGALERSSNFIARYISKDIKDFIEKVYRDDEAAFSLALAEWFAVCHNYSMSYMVLADAVKLKVSEANGLDYNAKDNDKFNNIIKYYRNSEISGLRDFAENYYKVREYRDGIAHSIAKKLNADSAINNLENYIDAIRQGFKVIEEQ